MIMNNEKWQVKMTMTVMSLTKLINLVRGDWDLFLM